MFAAPCSLCSKLQLGHFSSLAIGLWSVAAFSYLILRLNPYLPCSRSPSLMFPQLLPMPLSAQSDTSYTIVRPFCPYWFQRFVSLPFAIL
ncbi:uncharacterized protein BJ212DRAFT_1326621, partial [Suillus subaureus]